MSVSWISLDSRLTIEDVRGLLSPKSNTLNTSPASNIVITAPKADDAEIHFKQLISDLRLENFNASHVKITELSNGDSIDVGLEKSFERVEMSHKVEFIDFFFLDIFVIFQDFIFNYFFFLIQSLSLLSSSFLDG